MRIELMDAERVLLEEIADKQLKQAEIAAAYALALSSPDVDWAKVNHAIMERWSLTGLKRVKTLAWKLRERP